MAQILKKNPLFIHEAYFTSELDALTENLLKNYAVGKLLIEGDNRYLSGDLMQFLLNLIMPYRMVSPDAVKLCRTLLDESFSGTADFRCGGYRLLGNLIIDTDNENITQDRARLRFENDAPEMVALMDAFINKEFGVDYRDAVAVRCLDLVKKICNPSEAVKYVVALNKRSFLWDVLWEHVEKFALKR